MTKRKWGEWKKVDLTTYPFNLEDESWSKDIITEKEYQIVMALFSLEFEGKDLEYFDPETLEAPPPIPDELKIYCPEKEWDTEFWPTAIGNTEEHPYDWDKWFYIDFYTPYTIITGWKNRSLNGNWYMIEWEALCPILIRSVKEKKE